VPDFVSGYLFPLYQMGILSAILIVSSQASNGAKRQL
jgi:hypothetical protein